MLKIRVVVENTAAGTGLLAEHGLAFWIEHGTRRILFDTGQGYVLQHNLGRLGVSLETVDAVVLSHGHYDHVGALAEALAVGKPSALYLHPEALAPKYARGSDGASREIGMAAPTIAAVRSFGAAVWTEEPTELGDGAYVTGPIPRRTDFEDAGGPFFTDAACQQPDPLLDDQALYFFSQLGTVVVLGCAHAGLINTLRYVQELTSGRPIHTVMGGTHLVSASEERLDRTVAELRVLGVERLMPAHCTGFPAMARLRQEFPVGYASCSVGTIVEIEA